MGVSVTTVVLVVVVAVLFSCLFRDRVSRCGPDWPPTLDPAASVSSLQVPGLQACTSTPSSMLNFNHSTI